MFWTNKGAPNLLVQYQLRVRFLVMDKNLGHALNTHHFCPPSSNWYQVEQKFALRSIQKEEPMEE